MEKKNFYRQLRLSCVVLMLQHSLHVKYVLTLSIRKVYSMVVNQLWE